MFYFTGLHAGEVGVCCNHMLIVRANVRGMGRRCGVVQLGWSFQYVMPGVLAASLHPPRYIHSLGQGPNVWLLQFMKLKTNLYDYIVFNIQTILS
jgi:hypothetical protein